MMEFTIRTILNASAKEVYDTWLSSEGHSRMTGGEATASDKSGDQFMAWDGYIKGENLDLIKNVLIKQSWRTSQFEVSDPDSIIEITLKESNDQTELTLVHSNLPESGEHYKQGWDEHYFIPMKKYFSTK